MYDTIVAIASGNVNQAISIIRISGDESFNIVKKIFNGKIGKDKTIKYGFIVDKKEKIDEVLISFFKGKNNFIGEDTIEIMCHGGILVTNRILELILVHGARKANPGEFSRRAFLNGKMNLIKAQAINDLINAKTVVQTKIAMTKFNNNSSKEIDKLIKEIEYLIGICEVNIDYPEYDSVEEMNDKKMTIYVKELIEKIKKVIYSSESNQIFINPVRIAIVGQPNVGKSTLLNTILNEEKSIVTNIKGTTRDVVEGEVVFENIILKFFDTAGIRDSKDEIEKIGIEKSLNEIEKASIVFHVFDPQKKENKEDRIIAEKSSKKVYIKIFNKSDLLENESNKKEYIYISSKEKEISQLEKKLKEVLKTEISFDENNNEYFFNQKEISFLKKALLHLEEVISSLIEGNSYDLVIVDIYSAWESLKSIIGSTSKEDLLDSIFNNFCLGK